MSRSARRFADLDPLGHEERVGHAAADHQMIDLVPPDCPASSSLVDTLAPPTTAITGRAGVPKAASSARNSASINRPAAFGNSRAIAVGRGMRPVRGRKGIVAQDIAQRRHGAAPDRGSFASSAGVKAGVLQPEPHRRDWRWQSLPSRHADPIGREDHLAAQGGFQRGLTWRQAHLRHDLALWPVEMRQQHRPCRRAPECPSTVGTILSIRVVSVTRPPSIGTLMSTRRQHDLAGQAISSSVFQPIVVPPRLHRPAFLPAPIRHVNRSRPFALSLRRVVRR